MSHDELLRTVIECHSGYVFKTVSDAIYAVFPTVPDALQAALSERCRWWGTR